MLDGNKPHYGGGTAAGFKGNSLAARQNSAGAAHKVNKTLGTRVRWHVRRREMRCSKAGEKTMRGKGHRG